MNPATTTNTTLIATASFELSTAKRISSGFSEKLGCHSCHTFFRLSRQEESPNDSGAAERSVKPQPKSGRPVASSAGSIDDRNFLGVQKSGNFMEFWGFLAFSILFEVANSTGRLREKEELRISTYDIVSKFVLQEMFAGYMNMSICHICTSHISMVISG